METYGLSHYMSEYAKLLVINKKVSNDHIEPLHLYLDLFIEYFYGQSERSKSFLKSGGVKRLKSLPKILLENDEVSQKLNNIFNHLNHNT